MQSPLLFVVLLTAMLGANAGPVSADPKGEIVGEGLATCEDPQQYPQPPGALVIANPASSVQLRGVRLETSKRFLRGRFVMGSTISTGRYELSDASTTELFSVYLYRKNGRMFGSLLIDPDSDELTISRNTSGRGRSTPNSGAIRVDNEVVDFKVARRDLPPLTKGMRWAAGTFSVWFPVSETTGLQSNYHCPSAFDFEKVPNRVSPNALVPFPSRSAARGSTEKKPPTQGSSCDEAGLRIHVEDALAGEIAGEAVEILGIDCADSYAAVSWTAPGYQGGLLLFEQVVEGWSLMNEPFDIVLSCDAELYGISAADWTQLGLDELLPC